ncbi:hypothetical protein DYL61_25705 [Pseudomonas nabeulensis]|uniref:Delta-aminolevulinic acid dehydratase n=1 Tax=Pseudomonas nabeulensis TaxID=2293833 RepID=A0A4Z0AM36_9PSED|nr:hypothetical protein [Pseudomonas nabeulensis]TFY87705.1 hypothetical protein DYL61_25705 [Pseudomonas nabeulensis]
MTPPLSFPAMRLRRLRRTPLLRDMVRETRLGADDLIYPVFVEEGIEVAQEISTMPGVLRIPERHLARELEAIARKAVRESLLDEAEGADMLMVKPALAYLDVLARLRGQTLLPLVAYQVGGEYAMIKFAATAGAIDEVCTVQETLGAIKRAGADLIISYLAREYIRGV